MQSIQLIHSTSFLSLLTFSRFIEAILLRSNVLVSSWTVWIEISPDLSGLLLIDLKRRSDSRQLTSITLIVSYQPLLLQFLTIAFCKSLLLFRWNMKGLQLWVCVPCFWLISTEKAWYRQSPSNSKISYCTNYDWLISR